jgi:hypothetical protein
MSAHPEAETLQANACFALYVLDKGSAAGQSLTPQIVIKAVLVSMRGHTNSTIVQKNACMLLYELIPKSEENDDFAGEEGAVELVLTVMRGSKNLDM